MNKLIPVVLLATLMAAGLAAAQGPMGGTGSVDFQGPTAGRTPGPFTGILDGFGMAQIDEGSILTPSWLGVPGPNPPAPLPPGPIPPIGLMVSAMTSGAGTVPGGLGIVPGVRGGVEVDALSYGRDGGDELDFSVDEFARGIPQSPLPPNVFTEGAWGPAFEASADVFGYLGPLVPTSPSAPGLPIGNLGGADGNRLPSATGNVYQGIGLIEPNPPTWGDPRDEGDNLDAVDINTTLDDVNGRIYISLDSQFPDPLEALPANTGTAIGNGFVGGDVLVTSPGGAPQLYAQANVLGLDLVLGEDTDDLDALALWENGDGIFSPRQDRIYFSVRRGSAVIGQRDSRFLAPIEPGDVLEPPLPNGLSPFPAIFIPGEALGLLTTRSHGQQYDIQFGDDLDAMDVVPEPATALLLALGGLCLLAYTWRRRRGR